MNKNGFLEEGPKALTLNVRLDKVTPEKRIKIDLIKANELMCQIYPWIEASKLDFDKFGVILELIGVETPIRIYDIETKNGVNILQATTAGKRKITISLFVENRAMTAGFIVEEWKETIKGIKKEARFYKMNYGNEEVRLTLTGRKAQFLGKTINCVYKINECSIELSICDMLIFIIRIDKPRKMCDSPEVIKRSNEIIRYLINLSQEDILSNLSELMFEVRRNFLRNGVYGTADVHWR